MRLAKNHCLESMVAPPILVTIKIPKKICIKPMLFWMVTISLIKQVLPGSFSVFADRLKTVVSSTNPDYPVGIPLPLKDDLFRYKKG